MFKFLKNKVKDALDKISKKVEDEVPDEVPEVLEEAKETKKEESKENEVKPTEVKEVKSKGIISKIKKSISTKKISESKFEELFSELEMALLNATERYLLFKKSFPNLEQKIPQYHIASYLGVTATQLSRLRNKLLKE